MTDRGRSSPDKVENRPVRVLKFGGTSLGAREPFRNAVEIVQDAAGQVQPVVVVSAAAGVTDDLVRAADDTRGDRATAEAWVRQIQRRYRSLAREVLDEESLLARYATVLQTEGSELRRALQSRSRSEEQAAARHTVLASGERLMAPLLAAGLHGQDCAGEAVDAASLIRTDSPPGEVSVQWSQTREQVRTWFSTTRKTAELPIVPVITGFVAGTADGTTTTLGRGGSDLSAALIARALSAERLERWTDVEGLYTRDPNVHEDARKLDHLDFDQARTWTKAGRLGMHPCTLDPLAASDIPVHVRGIHRPEAVGTKITPPATVATKK